MTSREYLDSRDQHFLLALDGLTDAVKALAPQQSKPAPELDDLIVELATVRHLLKELSGYALDFCNAPGNDVLRDALKETATAARKFC